MITGHWEAYCRHHHEVVGLLDQRFYPIEWVDQRVWMGAIRLLSNDHAVAGFEIKQYPGGARELHGMFACGDLEHILPLVDEAEALARELKCHVFAIESRPGWSKLLKSRGFTPHQLRIVKELG